MPRSSICQSAGGFFVQTFFPGMFSWTLRPSFNPSKFSEKMVSPRTDAGASQPATQTMAAAAVLVAWRFIRAHSFSCR